MRDHRIVVITGSGISAESGLATFRDSGGLWEGYDINEVASFEGWVNNPERVQEFYNLRRKQAADAQPNKAHLALAELENYFDVRIITQNVDDLHERAGSSHVMHLHGELNKACSVNNHEIIECIGDEPIKMGDLAKDGAQLRPYVIWFGEAVPMIEPAAEMVSTANLLVVIGTSLVVYPAASLVDYTKPNIPKYLVDPSDPNIFSKEEWIHIRETAGSGVPKLVQKLITEYYNE